ncbi:hypothetical protein NTG1052_570032 [Candidatus Nitrotoga sp. 1052]|nr:hypothetical protein NTG1052_570032 [Candidatus Nitrotoga sp. 1052]
MHRKGRSIYEQQLKPVPAFANAAKEQALHKSIGAAAFLLILKEQLPPLYVCSKPSAL